MAILVARMELSDQKCPMPWCKSNRTTTAPGGGQICCECNVFFDKSNKKRRSFQDLLGGGIDQQSNEGRPGKRKFDCKHNAWKRLKTSSGDDKMHSFKNVRWTVERIPQTSTQYIPQTAPTPITTRLLRGAWTPGDDVTLMTARKTHVLNWEQIQAIYFPSKTMNACRKRHERLMYRRSWEDSETPKLETLGKNCMALEVAVRD
ncbi:hypothetical protein VE03_00432 [Pseudogymnoascus sp. 23342-1-I1]|nr:hypothetical protein VE03_00432 [Pseudogymnoascus sp. 23342-1-I1]